MKVGVIGCGVISRAYVENASAFESFELVACADLDQTQAEALAKASGLAVAGVDELIARSVDRRHPQPHAAARARGDHLAGARGRQARLHREAAGDRRVRGRRARPRGRAPRAAHRLRSRHLPRLGLPGRPRGDRRGRDRRPAVGQRRHARGRPGDLAPEPRHLLRRRRRPAVRHGPVLPDRDRGPARPDRARRRLRLDAHAGAHDRDRAAHRRALRRHHADAHDDGDAARRTASPRTSSRASRRAVSTSATSRSTAARACSCCPTRMRSAAPSASSAAAAAGRTCRTPRAAAPTPAASGSTTWWRPSRPAGRTAPPESSAPTSSRSPAASCAPPRRARVVEIESRVDQPEPLPGDQPGRGARSALLRSAPRRHGPGARGSSRRRRGVRSARRARAARPRSRARLAALLGGVAEDRRRRRRARAGTPRLVDRRADEDARIRLLERDVAVAGARQDRGHVAGFGHRERAGPAVRRIVGRRRADACDDLLGRTT